jgi:HsdM N-terminal domain
MKWIAPPEKDSGTETLEDRLWAAADQLRANSGLTSAQYSQPVLGLIFLGFADVRFLAKSAVLEKQASSGRRGWKLHIHSDDSIGRQPISPAFVPQLGEGRGRNLEDARPGQLHDVGDAVDARDGDSA